MPGGLHPHAHADSSLLQFSVELLGFTIAVIQLPFSALPSFLIHKSDLLKARMIIHTYNDHVGSFLPSLGRNATTVYSGRGSRHCYEITGARGLVGASIAPTRNGGISVVGAATIRGMSKRLRLPDFGMYFHTDSPSPIDFICRTPPNLFHDRSEE